METWDVLVIGGGPAGLSAALILGRCRRRVLVVDHGQARNRYSRGLHGYLTRDGILPAELLQLGRDELRAYPTVALREGEVMHLRGESGQFVATLHNGEKLQARKILIATGVIDSLPGIPGFEAFYGTSVFHCPLCDGWESRDKPIAAYGTERKGVPLALQLTLWSNRVILCSHGPCELTDEERRLFAQRSITLYQNPIERLEGRLDRMEQIVFANGECVACEALFFCTAQYKRSALAEMMGCESGENGCIATEDCERTCVPGVFAIGDISGAPQMAIVAAGEGAQAAVAINKELMSEDLGIAC